MIHYTSSLFGPLISTSCSNSGQARPGLRALESVRLALRANSATVWRSPAAGILIAETAEAVAAALESILRACIRPGTRSARAADALLSGRALGLTAAVAHFGAVDDTVAAKRTWTAVRARAHFSRIADAIAAERTRTAVRARARFSRIADAIAAKRAGAAVPRAGGAGFTAVAGPVAAICIALAHHGRPRPTAAALSARRTEAGSAVA